MRKHIVLLLVLLMVALPIWSAASVCHHVKTQPLTIQMADHHCCLDKQKTSANPTSADTCHCDQLQHAQFILSLPEMVAAAPTHCFIPPALPFQPLPKRADVPYRPPIA
ncbi:MAG: hypothetical protein PHE17_19975 [Thiothrix sp.]|uniref:hypothetical protein n=1 Tax=Thiothrix sp. TaxID=1032 RepID=UPI0026354B7A|nr:hypothetical protein [Thiothrix sp.]MDD5395308.1 hypothetical protein [Thiothrix sp.]